MSSSRKAFVYDEVGRLRLTLTGSFDLVTRLAQEAVDGKDWTFYVQ